MMKKALEGSLEPSFYVYPFDTGFGKSTLIKAFLRLWKAEGFNPEGSILIILKTMEEIKTFIEGCGLGGGDFAAFTKNEAVNSLGLGSGNRDDAPVLFTTHAMARARLRQKSFKSASEFYYKCCCRTLRIWDEEAERAESIHLPLDDITKIFGPIRPYYADWVEGLESFAALAKRAGVHSSLTIPKRLGSGRQFKYVEGQAPILTADQLEIVKQVKAAQGKPLLLCSGKKYGKTLVGRKAPFPNDLAPMLIFDASARIGDTYHLWSKVQKVRVMPALVRDYRNLTIRIWKTACGSAVLEDEHKRGGILSAIGREINGNPQPTLLIGKKPREKLFDLHAELSEHLGDKNVLSFRHWGIHYGTNDFQHIKRMFVIGEHRPRETVGIATYMAASGVLPKAVIGDEWIAINRAVIQRNLLQAFSRGNLRNGTNGECGECIVYWIVPHSNDPVKLAYETFPGCKVEMWEPYGTVLKGQAKAVFDVLKAKVDRGVRGEVSKMDVRMQVPIARAARLSHLLTEPTLKKSLAEIGIDWNKNNFIISQPKPIVTISEIVRRRRERKTALYTANAALAA